LWNHLVIPSFVIFNMFHLVPSPLQLLLDFHYYNVGRPRAYAKILRNEKTDRFDRRVRSGAEAEVVGEEEERKKDPKKGWHSQFPPPLNKACVVRMRRLGEWRSTPILFSLKGTPRRRRHSKEEKTSPRDKFSAFFLSSFLSFRTPRYNSSVHDSPREPITEGPVGRRTYFFFILFSKPTGTWVKRAIVFRDSLIWDSLGVTCSRLEILIEKACVNFTRLGFNSFDVFTARLSQFNLLTQLPFLIGLINTRARSNFGGGGGSVERPTSSLIN
jgi:hypothetical protein